MHTISFALLLLFTSTALVDQVAQSDIEVADGSTVRGLERMLAARAMSRLRQIVRSGERIEVEKEACSIDLEGMARRSVVTPGTAGR